MKRICLPVLLILCLLLSACSSAAEGKFRAFSEDLAARDSLHFKAKLRAEYPDRTLDFTLDYALQDGEQRVTVLEPESIRGVRARLLPGETRLEYEGLLLDAPALGCAELSPMSALPLLVETLRRGHLDSHWQEGGALAVQLILTDELRATVRFEPESMRPVSAELFCADRLVIACEITDWR